MRGEISSDRFFLRFITLSCGTITGYIGVILLSCDAHGVICYPFKGPFHETSLTAMTRSRTGDEFLFGEFHKILFAFGIPEIVLPFHVCNSRKSPTTTTLFLILYRANSICCTPVNKLIIFLNNLLCGFECQLWHCIIQRLEIFERFLNLYSRKIKFFEFLSTKITKLGYSKLRMRVLLIESRGNFKVLLKAFIGMEMLFWG
jgi:hypothetical protein